MLTQQLSVMLLGDSTVSVSVLGSEGGSGAFVSMWTYSFSDLSGRTMWPWSAPNACCLHCKSFVSVSVILLRIYIRPMSFFIFFNQRYPTAGKQTITCVVLMGRFSSYCDLCVNLTWWMIKTLNFCHFITQTKRLSPPLQSNVTASQMQTHRGGGVHLMKSLGWPVIDWWLSQVGHQGHSGLRALVKFLACVAFLWCWRTYQ